MDDLMVNVKVPRSFNFDMFTGTLYCYSSDCEILKCVKCPYVGTECCIAVKLKSNGLCVEEEEVTTAVADAGKSSCRDSETLHPDGSERSVVLNP